jgi:hypothetical protein
MPMINNELLHEILFSSLGRMKELNFKRGPSNLLKMMISLAGVDEIILTEDDVSAVFFGVRSNDPNDKFFTAIGRFLRECDATEVKKWHEETGTFTDERRSLVLEKLCLPSDVALIFNDKLPVAKPEGFPVIIAEDHKEWYTAMRQESSSFYWDAYSQYLERSGGWPQDSIIALNKASNLIVERFSDPESQEIYATKGLVVGYVQSGKTANFTAVAAKAADAGYRLIIVIAGTLNILREQTQRRFDKELIGKELIVSGAVDHDYVESSDWDEFISHGVTPSIQGAFDWKRLTGEADDYKLLKRGLETLEFKSSVPGRRFNDPANLHSAPAVLVVLKKIPSVLKKLNKDLSNLKTHLAEVPVLIIDDESDQASVNTVNPDKKTVKDRTATNEQIIKLIQNLPRAQYVGYTATPFANVFINPTDFKDLYPKDYILALPKPMDYMGVYDFFDFAEDGSEPDPSDRPKERAFIRDIKGDDEEKENLPRAINAFILSGAIKLFRENKGETVSIKHHTMLIHRSVKQADHKADAQLVQSIYDDSNPGSAKFYSTLESVWNEDFKPICKELALYKIHLDNFDSLRPYIDQCVSLIQSSGKAVRVVNGDKEYQDDLPNFDRDRVWSILVGGTKLSRGYTVEGLTISYYRRCIKQADTLMQVGRWFGFRRGYRDLVRLYVGRNEVSGKNKTMDLYEAFKSICRDEEVFRKELEKYADPTITPRILPEQVPPLVPSHILPPTAKNKMWHTKIQHQNFSQAWKESGRPDSSIKGHNNNSRVFCDLLNSSNKIGRRALSYLYKDKLISWDAYVWEADLQLLIHFLEKYKWSCDGLMQREIDFLKGKGDKSPEIDRCVIIMPQTAKPSDNTWKTYSVFNRREISSGAFNGFSEPRHVSAAEAIALNVTPNDANDGLKELLATRTAVLVVYPTIGRDSNYMQGEIPNDKITIGFGVKFPINKIQSPITYSV